MKMKLLMALAILVIAVWGFFILAQDEKEGKSNAKDLLIDSGAETAQTGVMLHVPPQDTLIKSEVETAVSMLQAIYVKQQAGEMTIEQAKKLGADLLRELKYGNDGYFWADTTEGVNVVLYGRKDVEGRNRIEDKDQKGDFYVKEFIAKAKAGGGYTNYWFPKKGETTAHPKRSYSLEFKPFGWIVGSGYYL